MTYKNFFGSLLVLTNLFLLIFIIQGESKAPTEIYMHNHEADKKRIKVLETSLKDMNLAIKELKLVINSLEYESESPINDSELALIQSPKEILNEFQPYESTSGVVESSVSAMRLNNLPSGYFESRQEAYNLLNESSLFDDDVDEDN